METPNEFADLIAEAEALCAETGIKLSTLGLYAVKSSRWFDERRAGKPCLNTTVDRVRRFISRTRLVGLSAARAELEDAA